MAPWDAGILDTLAAALAGVGRCSEAVSTQARAMDMASEGSSPTQRASYAKRMANLQLKCSATAAELPPSAVSAPSTGLAPKP